MPHQKTRFPEASYAQRLGASIFFDQIFTEFCIHKYESLATMHEQNCSTFAVPQQDTIRWWHDGYFVASAM